MAYIKNPKYNPNDPASQRYIQDTTALVLPNTSANSLPGLITTPVPVKPVAPVNPLPAALQVPATGTTTAPSKTSTPIVPVKPTPVMPTRPAAPTLNTQQSTSIQNLINSGRAFNETDARNYAYATTGNAENYKKFLNKTGAQITAEGGTTTPSAPPTINPGGTNVDPTYTPTAPGGTSSYDVPKPTGNEVTDTALKDLAVQAGKAGMKLSDYLDLISATGAPDQAQSQEIRNKLGIPDLVDKAFSQPAQTTVDQYKQLYSDVGLNEVKTKIKEIDDSVAKKRADLVTATGELMNNPWISQGTRQGRLKNLQELAFADIQNDLDIKDQYLTQYDQGVSEIEDAIKRSVYDQGAERDLTVDKLNYLLTQAEADDKLVERTMTKRALRYIPEYLQNQPKDSADGFTLKEGETRYDAAGNVIATGGDSTKTTKEKDTQVQTLDSKIDLIDSILSSPGLTGSVGAYAIGRFTPGTPDKAARQDFAASVSQLVDQETLSTLLQLKAAGGTLGAISEKELSILQNAATKISKWAQVDDKGNPTGKYEVSEEAFKAELQKIKDSALRLKTALTGQTQKVDLKKYYPTADAKTRAAIDKMLDQDYSDEEILQALGFSNELQTSKNGLSPIAASIVQQESGGNYKAVGDVPAGYNEADKALGKYQIIPKYHFGKIGLENTPAGRQKFLNSPQLQDQLFSIIIDGLNRQYNGDPAKVAAAYYGGAGGASVVGTKAGDKPQMAGGKQYPSVNQYVRSVLSRLQTA